MDIAYRADLYQPDFCGGDCVVAFCQQGAGAYFTQEKPEKDGKILMEGIDWLHGMKGQELSIWVNMLC